MCHMATLAVMLKIAWRVRSGGRKIKAVEERGKQTICSYVGSSLTQANANASRCVCVCACVSADIM